MVAAPRAKPRYDGRKPRLRALFQRIANMRDHLTAATAIRVHEYELPEGGHCDLIAPHRVWCQCCGK